MDKMVDFMSNMEAKVNRQAVSSVKDDLGGASLLNKN
jgi:hypothetical protein